PHLLIQGSPAPRVLHSFPTRRSSDLRPLIFHFPEPGVRYTRATPTLRRPTACQRSSGVIAALIGPPPSRAARAAGRRAGARDRQDRKSTRLNSSHVSISYAVFCLKKK